MSVLIGHHSTWSVPPGAVTIGVFDGVHRGHQRILEVLRETAGTSPITVLTFSRHPAELTSPGGAPPLLCTLDRRVELLEAHGADVVALLEFDDAMRRMPAERFVEEVVIGALRAEHVIVGDGFRFGHELGGDLAMLGVLGERLGFVVGHVPIVGGERPISSTAIRSAVSEGRVVEAAEMLGRPFELEGTVVEGDHRGVLIGFPTANLSVPEGLLMPARGVYAVRATVVGRECAGVMNVGVRPTFDGTKEVAEVHLLDFEGDLYGVEMRAAVVARLRDEMKFGGVDDLVDQIGVDVEEASRLLSQGS